MKGNMIDNNMIKSLLESSVAMDDMDDRAFKDMKYARIIYLIAEKQNIPHEAAMDMLYSSPLFELIDDGTADLICRSDLYLAGEIIRMNKRKNERPHNN